MRITIDSAGRVVIPKALRDAAGITPSTPIEVRFRDGRLELEPAALEVSISDEGGVAVAIAAEAVPVLRAEDVATVRDRSRDERG